MNSSQPSEELLARFLQISDLHSVSKSRPLHAKSVSGRLDQVKRMVAQIWPIPDAVLLTGDLVDNSAGEDYREVVQFVDSLEQLLGRPVIPMMGNHDERSVFESYFGDLPNSVERRPDDLHDHVRIIGGVRLVVLDSTVSRRSYGELDEKQLEWLEQVLSNRYAGGTVLAMHHPPVLSLMPQLHYAGLRNSDRLAVALHKSDVRLIISGHYHHTAASWWHQRLVWCGPALSYTQDVVAPSPRIRGWDQGHFSVIDVTASTASASVVGVPNEREQPVLDYDLDLSQKASQWHEPPKGELNRSILEPADEYEGKS